jgi:hypothetical protein
MVLPLPVSCFTLILWLSSVLKLIFNWTFIKLTPRNRSIIIVFTTAYRHHRLWLYSPSGPRLPLIRFLNHIVRHTVGLPGWAISPSQGLCLHRTTQHRNTKDKHPCPERDSNRDPVYESSRPTPQTAATTVYRPSLFRASWIHSIPPRIPETCHFPFQWHKMLFFLKYKHNYTNNCVNTHSSNHFALQYHPQFLRPSTVHGHWCYNRL